MNFFPFPVRSRATPTDGQKFAVRIAAEHLMAAISDLNVHEITAEDLDPATLEWLRDLRGDLLGFLKGVS